jgi:N-acetylneuraminic acid mutarotase
LKGGKNPAPSELWKYTISTDSWSTVSTTPRPVHLGAGIVHQPDAVYVLRGNNQRDFGRYDITLDTWASLQDVDAGVRDGGSLAVATDGGTTYLYAMRGKSTDSFWRYDIALDVWSALAVTPAAVDDGGALAWDGADTIFAYRGANQPDF